MAKPKNPVISLGAQGTIGGTITFQHRPGGTIAREKPVPSQPQTLPQLYQRWLYRDYCEYWNSFTQTQKDAYRADGSKRHMSAFAYFMSQHLGLMPDIIGGWHLDGEAGNIALDFTPNQNHGTVVGASPVDGLIAGGRHFDAIDDVISIPHASSLNLGTDDFTLEGFMNLPDTAAHRFLISKNAWANGSWLLMIGLGRDVYLYLRDAGGAALTTDSVLNTAPLNTDFHLAATVDRDGVARLFIDAQEVTYNRQPNLAALGSLDSNQDLYLGHPTIAGRSKGLKDEVRVYRRILSVADFTRHAGRRYPPYSLDTL